MMQILVFSSHVIPFDFETNNVLDEEHEKDQSFFLTDDNILLNVACYQIHQTYLYQNRRFFTLPYLSFFIGVD